MNHKFTSILATTALLALSVSAQALTLQFNAGLNGGMHIHAPAAPGFNGPVVVSLTSPNFLVFNSGSSILIGGAGVAPPSSVFLSQLQAGLAYVNLHTALYPRGEIRGQLIQVAVVPEPSTHAMLLSGLGLIGVFVSRCTQVR